MKRREMLHALGGVVLGGTALGLERLGGAPRPETPTAPDRLERIGVQLYTVRRAMAEDVEGTLARVGQVGYREVEFAGYFDRSPREVRAALEAAGLAAPAAHVLLPEASDAWERTLEAATAIGHQALIVPWIPEGRRRTLDDYRAVAESLNRAGDKARSAGFRFAYHNHDFEFASLEGRVPFDVLLEATDPELVAFELDLFWIIKGGYRPLEYFARYPGRFEFVHVKDMTADGTMVDVGRGTIDFAAIFAKGKEAGIRHYFVEHDEPSDPFESIGTSYQYLRGLEF